MDMKFHSCYAHAARVDNTNLNRVLDIQAPHPRTVPILLDAFVTRSFVRSGQLNSAFKNEFWDFGINVDR